MMAAMMTMGIDDGVAVVAWCVVRTAAGGGGGGGIW
jgi:hypothetical protein